MEAANEGLHPQIVSNIVQSEIEGGVRMDDVPVGGTIRMQTRSRLYTIRKTGEDAYTIEGHPEYCPAPVRAYIGGSTWGGSMLKMKYIGIGMRLEFSTDEHRCITTSEIKAIEVI